MQQPLSDAFLRLVGIMDELREKCPWDKKQTIHTLRQQTIEETYELTDAITGEDWKGIKEELGDLLLHTVFYAKIGAEQGKFTLTDVLEGISEFFNKSFGVNAVLLVHIERAEFELFAEPAISFGCRQFLLCGKVFVFCPVFLIAYSNAEAARGSCGIGLQDEDTVQRFQQLC